MATRKKQPTVGEVFRDYGMGSVGAVATDVVNDAINNNVAFFNKAPAIMHSITDVAGLVMAKRGNDYVRPLGMGMSIISTVNLARPLTGNLKLGLGRAIYGMGYAPGRRGREGSGE